MAENPTPNPFGGLHVQLEYLSRFDRPEYYRKIREAYYTLDHMDRLFSKADLASLREELEQGQDQFLSEEIEEFLSGWTEPDDG